MAAAAAAAEAAWVPPRFVLGCWQMSSGHHGPLDEEETRLALEFHLGLGVRAVDCGDIYTGVEQRLGDFFQRCVGSEGGGLAESAAAVRVHTKLVPDFDRLPDLEAADVEATLRRSIRRLRLPRGQPLELVQLHWWDLSRGSAADALRLLASFGRGPVPLVRHVGLTNFGAVATRRLLEEDIGAPVVSTQVQLSLLDQRAATSGLLELCREHGVAVLCYGTVAGGLLSERWLGAAEPQEWGEPVRAETRSLTKYILMAREGGTWEDLQQLLQCLDRVATRHQASISEVAIAWALAQPAVASAIVGLPRNSGAGPETPAAKRAAASVAAAAGLRLAAADLEEIGAAAVNRREAAVRLGDFYEAERDKEGVHGSVMRYNLNRICEVEHAREVLIAAGELEAQGDASKEDSRVLHAERLLWEVEALLTRGRSLDDTTVEELRQAQCRLAKVKGQ
eukprot:CAMPEP_0203848984 /NCGR_PEP_ID=MMETSP0359-20131031/5921_1 /ASSEMBLY_ACC=CAM_ASM_000338 /TAXON_ID=268821 /ORGANISM="Scrippsiella Hangoei, Strain SHTV-5" /LENGTH=450 /DNA_ID=CAMNT_0050764667 /DNA_START=23 /DNA_END=1375 /DNA_ORIENTATION=+